MYISNLLKGLTIVGLWSQKRKQKDKVGSGKEMSTTMTTIMMMSRRGPKNEREEDWGGEDK